MKAVYGSGFAAVLAVTELRTQGHPVVWVKGAGTSVIPPFSTFSNLETATCLVNLLQPTGLFSDEELQITEAAFLRESRNRAFRIAKVDEFSETFLGTENYLAADTFARLGISLNEVHQRLLTALSKVSESDLKVVEGLSIRGFDLNSEGKIEKIRFFSGEKFPVTGLILAENSAEIAKIEGLTSDFFPLRTRGLMGVLQATLEHSNLGASSLEDEVFVSKLHRESGETEDRHVWGEFFQNGTRSVWTVVLTPEESEDRHRVGKRWRRIKQALDKMFQGEAWLGLPSNGKELCFSDKIENERIRFVEDAYFSTGEPAQLLRFLPEETKNRGIDFISEGYGVGHSIRMVAHVLKQTSVSESLVTHPPESTFVSEQAPTM